VKVVTLAHAFFHHCRLITVVAGATVVSTAAGQPHQTSCGSGEVFPQRLGRPLPHQGKGGPILFAMRHGGQPYTGSISLGSLFLTLPTRLLTGQHVIPAAGSGTNMHGVR
jgi:hypothetical protein